MSLQVVPLTPDTWETMAEFGRTSGTDLHWCWCQYWRLRSKDFAALKVPELRERLHDQAAGDEPPGLVAMEGDRAVGWVSLAPREQYERLERSRVIPRIDDTPVWSIVCFAVSATARGRGVGRALLNAAVAYATEQGATTLEAYPADLAPGERLHPDAAFGGTRAMFESAGFAIVAETDSKVGGVPRVVMRRALDASAVG